MKTQVGTSIEIKVKTIKNKPKEEVKEDTKKEE